MKHLWAFSNCIIILTMRYPSAKCNSCWHLFLLFVHLTNIYCLHCSVPRAVAREVYETPTACSLIQDLKCISTLMDRARTGESTEWVPDLPIMDSRGASWRKWCLNPDLKDEHELDSQNTALQRRLWVKLLGSPWHGASCFVLRTMLQELKQTQGTLVHVWHIRAK